MRSKDCFCHSKFILINRQNTPLKLVSWLHVLLQKGNAPLVTLPVYLPRTVVTFNIYDENKCRHNSRVGGAEQEYLLSKAKVKHV